MIRNGALNSLKALIICMIRLKKMVGVSNGRVMVKNVRIRPAPSTLAASQSSAGTFFNAARKSTMEEPNCQTTRSPMVTNARLGLPSQSRAGMCRWARKVFTVPFLLNRNFHRIEIATEPPRMEGR